MIQESYPRSSEDLGKCFELLERSAYYDFSLHRREVIAAWQKLTTEGIGHFLRTEYLTSSKVSDTTNSRFLSLFFTVFVTREYATHLVKNVAIKNVGMDFLRWYHDFHFKQIGINPCPTPAELEAGVDLHCLIPVMLFSPELGGMPHQLRRTLEYSHWMRASAARSFGGFRFRSWFADVVGSDIKNVLCFAGLKLLRDYADNVGAVKGRERYLLCVTPDKRSSEQICIPETVRCDIEVGNWLYEMFDFREQQVALSSTEKRIGALLVMNRSKSEIASLLYPNAAQSEKAVQSGFEQMGKKLKNAGYIAWDSSVTLDILKQTLLTHLQEIRPAIYWHLLS
ncbi:MAG: hypothetical protein H7Y38_10950 [Armatimonadetes bacterium]|nr:hypothetical protein [Armatimonadota bacterium]